MVAPPVMHDRWSISRTISRATGRATCHTTSQLVARLCDRLYHQSLALQDQYIYIGAVSGLQVTLHYSAEESRSILLVWLYSQEDLPSCWPGYRWKNNSCIGETKKPAYGGKKAPILGMSFNRSFYCNYANLMQELERESHGDFIKQHSHGISHVPWSASLSDPTTDQSGYRCPLEPGLKLAITLRHMATGNSYHSLSYSFQVPHNTMYRMVREVSAAIVTEYEAGVFDFPTTPQRWHQVKLIFPCN